MSPLSHVVRCSGSKLQLNGEMVTQCDTWPSLPVLFLSPFELVLALGSSQFCLYFEWNIKHSNVSWHPCILSSPWLPICPWHAIAFIAVAIGEVSPLCDRNEWLPLWMATQIMASTDGTFLPCGSEWSVSILHPSCCHPSRCLLVAGEFVSSTHWLGYSI